MLGEGEAEGEAGWCCWFWVCGARGEVEGGFVGLLVVVLLVVVAVEGGAWKRVGGGRRWRVGFGPWDNLLVGDGVDMVWGFGGESMGWRCNRFVVRRFVQETYIR